MSMSCSWDSTSAKYKIKCKEIGSLQFTLFYSDPTFTKKTKTKKNINICINKFLLYLNHNPCF
jgi:phage-related protein